MSRTPNQSASEPPPVGQSDGLGNLSATVAADRAFPAAVTEVVRRRISAFQKRVRNEISLREVREGDLPIFFRHQVDPEATQMAAFPARAYDEFMAHWAKCMAEKTTILRTIVFQEEVAGNIVYWEKSGEGRVGYWLGKEYWGKGIASAALAQFLGHVKARPLYARVAKGNAASIRVLQKCGFTISGEDTFRDLAGAPASEFIMALEAQSSDEEE